jgi:hypothetical protein
MLQQRPTAAIVGQAACSRTHRQNVILDGGKHPAQNEKKWQFWYWIGIRAHTYKRHPHFLQEYSCLKSWKAAEGALGSGHLGASSRRHHLSLAIHPFELSETWTRSSEFLF